MLAWTYGGYTALNVKRKSCIENIKGWMACIWVEMVMVFVENRVRLGQYDLVCFQNDTRQAHVQKNNDMRKFLFSLGVTDFIWIENQVAPYTYAKMRQDRKLCSPYKKQDEGPNGSPLPKNLQISWLVRDTDTKSTLDQACDLLRQT